MSWRDAQWKFGGRCAYQSFSELDWKRAIWYNLLESCLLNDCFTLWMPITQCCVLCIILQLLGPKKPPDLSEPVREYLVIFSEPLPWIFCVACVYGKKCQALHKGRHMRDKLYDDEIFEPCPILILALAYLINGLMANSNRWQKFTNCFLKAWSWLWLKGRSTWTPKFSNPPNSHEGLHACLGVFFFLGCFEHWQFNEINLLEFCLKHWTKSLKIHSQWVCMINTSGQKDQLTS